MRFRLALAGILLATAASAADIKIALIAGKTGPLEAYAKQTEAGFMMGLEYLTKGTMTWQGRKVSVIVKDDQLKADLAKTLLEQAYNDDKVDIAVGTTSSAAALAMLPVAEENGKVLIVEPAVADAITGEKWNRFIFRTARNSTQDAYAAAAAVPATRRGHDRDARAGLRLRTRRRRRAQERARGHPAQREGRVRGIHAAERDRLHRLRAAHLRRAEGQARAIRSSTIIWAGQHPLPKIADLKPERYGIEIAPGGNILPACRSTRTIPAWKARSYIITRTSPRTR